MRALKEVGISLVSNALVLMVTTHTSSTFITRTAKISQVKFKYTQKINVIRISSLAVNLMLYFRPN